MNAALRKPPWTIVLGSVLLLAACGSGTAHVGPDVWTQADAGAHDAAPHDALPSDASVDAGAAEDASAPVCGNGAIEDPEVCDDGNSVGGDGCSADCRESVSTVSLGFDSPAYDISRDNSDQVHLIWTVGSGPGTTLWYGLITGCQLTDDEQAATAGGIWTRGFRPRIAVRPDGAFVHTSWGDGGMSEIRHAWRDGSGWQQEVLFTEPGGMFVAQPVSGVDMGGNVHIIALYQEDSEPFSGRIAYWRMDSGGSLLESQEIIDGPDPGVDWRSTAMFTTRTGDIHAAWKAPNHWGRYGHASSGSVLGDQPFLDIPPAPSSVHTGMGDLFVTESGDVHAVCTDFVGTDSGIWHAIKPVGAQVFDTPTTQVSTFTDNGGSLNFDPWPAVVVEPTGARVLASWGENPSGTNTVSNVYLSRLESGGWTPGLFDSGANINSFGKVAMTVTSDTTYMVWRATTTTGSELRCTRFRFAP